MSRILAITLGLSVLAACGTTATSAVIRCQLDALRALPEDPMQVTVFDSVDLVTKLKACREPAADAGAK